MKFPYKLLVYLVSVILVLFISVSLFITSPFFTSRVKSYLSAYLSRHLHKKLTIKSLKIFLFAPQVRIRGVALEGVGAVARADVYFGRLDLFGRKIFINKIAVSGTSFVLQVKNGRVENYPGISRAIKFFTGKSNLPFSVSVEKLV